MEVVVIGYGEVKKEDLTGSIATLSTKDFNKGVTTSPQDLLVGRIAGVSVVSDGGAPGSGTTIRIRGGSSMSASNDPLIIIDGFPVDNTDISGVSNPLSTINPNDIESFTVLKDASATAIYGSRASNGVIIVTTKKGAEGKPKFEFNSQISMSQPIKYVDVLNGDEYRSLINSLYEEGFSGINSDALARLGNENTDWQKEIFQNAVSQDYNLTGSGAIKKVPFRVSYGYTDQQGILKTTSMVRNSISANINPKFFDDHLSVNVNYKQSFTNSNFGDQGAVGSAVSFDPTQPVRNGNQRYAGYFAWTTENLEGTNIMDPEGPANTFSTNPVAMLNLRENIGNVNRLIGNVQLDYKMHFLPELSANLNLGTDNSNTDGYDDALPGSTWTYRDYTGGNGRLLDYTAKNKSDLLDFYLKYGNDFGKHNLEIMGGYSWQHFYREGTTFDRNGDETQILEDSQYKNENYLVSFFGRLNYTFNNKYLLTATFRDDGSSRFAEGNQWAFFPSVALAWKINEESFLANASAVTNLKLRLGYGNTGQQDISDNQYPALAVYQQSIEGASYQFGDRFLQTLRPNRYDANIKWEETTTYNVGLDFGFFKERLYGSIDVYQRKTKDLINTIPIPAGSNFSNYLTTNVGDLENVGYEISVTGQIVDQSDFTWNLGVNFTQNTNKITKLTKIDDPNYPGVAVGGISGGVGNNIQIHTVGYPANSFYVFQQVYNEAGDPIEALYVDRTGTGGEVASNELNKYHLNNPVADMWAGINTSLRYKNLDFGFSGRLSIGNYMYNNGLSNATLTALYYPTGYFTNIRREGRDIGFENPQYWSDLYVVDASFFKMDNMSLGYTFNELFTDKLSGRLSFTVQNAFIITDYSGIDPEVFNGIDNNQYPRPRTYIVGLNLNF
jgi:iron complex outermembrane receptor protein